MENTPAKTTLNKLNITLIAIIVILIAIIIYLLYNRQIIVQQVEEATNEATVALTAKDSLSIALSDLYSKYDNLKSDNEGLNTKLETEQAKIKKMIVQINSMKNTNGADIEKYKGELESMRNIMKSYVRQIDSLNTLNQTLTEQNHQIKNDYQNTKKENTDLSEKNKTLNEKVVKASFIKAMNINVIGLNDKDREVKKVKKIDKFKITFTLTENAVVDQGIRTVYIRISRPDDYILPNSSNELFTYQGNSISYTCKRDVNYLNQSIEMEMFWERNEDLMAGTYFVDLYLDNNKIGTASVVLK